MFKVDAHVDTELIETISKNLEIFTSHSEESQTRFFTPLEIRKVVERGNSVSISCADRVTDLCFVDELTMIKFLEALYDPEVLFIFFPYIVDESSSTYFCSN